MAKNRKKRTQAKNLPQPEQEMTAKASKNVKGGLRSRHAQSLETFAAVSSTSFEGTVAGGGSVVSGPSDGGSAAGDSSVAGRSG